MKKKLYKVQFEAFLEIPVIADDSDKARRTAEEFITRETRSDPDIWLFQATVPVTDKRHIPAGKRFAYCDDGEGEWVIDRLPDEFFGE